jgi:hypothetical protein
MDGECVEVCPTDVVTLTVQPVEEKTMELVKGSAS